MAATVDLEAERVLARRERAQALEVRIGTGPLPRSEAGDKDKVAEALDWLRVRLAKEEDRPAMDRAQYRAYALGLLEEVRDQYTPAEREQAAGEITDLQYGWGKLDSLMSDPTVTEVAVDSPEAVCFWRDGVIWDADGRDGRPLVRFRDDDEVLRWVLGKTQFEGRHFDRVNAILNLMLPDGTRLQATREPVTPCVTLNLRKPPATTRRWTPEDYAATGAASPELLEFLLMAVRGGANVFVLGPTGTGKTALMRLLQERGMPQDLRLLILEAERELQPVRPHTVSLQEVRHGSRRGRDEATAISMDDLVDTTLRKSPSRASIGEILGPAEASAAFRIVNNGHDGILTSMHARSPEAAVDLLIAYVSGGIWRGLPADRIERLIHSSLDLFVFLRRLPGETPGTRQIRITEVYEVLPLPRDGRGEPFRLVWKWVGRLKRHVYLSHVSPEKLERWQQEGAEIPDMFGVKELEAHITRRLAEWGVDDAGVDRGGGRRGGGVAAAGAGRKRRPEKAS